MATDKTLYVRNGRPNRIVFHAGGVRYMLEHRGNRQDSAALPADAAQEPQVVRWLQSGQLEKISRESFMALGARQVDTLPNEFLKRDVRATNAHDVKMKPAEADATKTLSQVDEGDVHKTVRNRLRPEWAGDLMTTEEELETLDITQKHQAYPSKHRDDGVRRQMGY